MDSYKTIRNDGYDEYIVKKSRFIGNIAHVTSQEEAMEFINNISKKYWDATHNVYAYILKNSGAKKFSDDGEPQGTAGMPVLDVLEKNGLTDCAVVVTRYFGGIMLGAGGLVRAYSHSASIAVTAGGIVTRALCDKLLVNCDYGFYGKLTSLIPENGGIIEDTDYADNVKVIFRIPSDLTEGINAKIRDASNGNYMCIKTGESFEDID